MTDMFGEAWSPMSVPDLAPDDDDDCLDFSLLLFEITGLILIVKDQDGMKENINNAARVINYFKLSKDLLIAGMGDLRIFTEFRIFFFYPRGKKKQPEPGKLTIFSGEKMAV